MIAMSTPRLSDTSYAVLGLLDLFEPATPYQLKQIAQVSIFHFWSIPHEGKPVASDVVETAMHWR